MQDNVKQFYSFTSTHKHRRHNTTIHAHFSFSACYYNRKTYEDGSQFDLDACTRCSCRHGDVQCSKTACPAVSCPNPITPPGECCPICTSGKWGLSLEGFYRCTFIYLLWMIGIAQLLGSSTQMQCILRSIYRGVTIYPSKLHVSLNLSMIFLDWWILQFITSDVVLPS